MHNANFSGVISPDGFIPSWISKNRTADASELMTEKEWVAVVLLQIKTEIAGQTDVNGAGIGKLCSL